MRECSRQTCLRGNFSWRGSPPESGVDIASGTAGRGNVLVRATIFYPTDVARRLPILTTTTTTGRAVDQRAWRGAVAGALDQAAPSDRG